MPQNSASALIPVFRYAAHENAKLFIVRRNRHASIRARILLSHSYRMQSIQGQHVMPKERKSNKEAKKKALLTPKERKAAKQVKKAEKPFLGD